MQQFVSMEEAFGAIEEHASKRLIETIRVPLPEAVGRVLAEPAIAKLSIPPFNNSARDGVLLSSAGIVAAREGQPLTLAGELRAGDTIETAENLLGDAARIMTGAPVPSWGAAIVMIEDVALTDTCPSTRCPILALGSDRRGRISRLAETFSNPVVGLFLNMFKRLPQAGSLSLPCIASRESAFAQRVRSWSISHQGRQALGRSMTPIGPL